MAVDATAAQSLWPHRILTTLLKYITPNIHFISFNIGFDNARVHGSRQSIEVGLILYYFKIQASLSMQIQVLRNATTRLLVHIYRCFEHSHITIVSMIRYFQKNRKSISGYSNLLARGCNISEDFTPQIKLK